MSLLQPAHTRRSRAGLRVRMVRGRVPRSVGGFRVGVHWLPGLEPWGSGCGLIPWEVAITTTPIVIGRDLVPVSEPLFSDSERAALAGFLAGYSGLTREAYTLDLRQYTSWCAQHGLHLFTAQRADVECFGRDMEAAGRARATIARRLCTVARVLPLRR